MSIETPNHQDERASETVVNYVLRRLAQIGIADVFGVAGDFAFRLRADMDVVVRRNVRPGPDKHLDPARHLRGELLRVRRRRLRVAANSGHRKGKKKGTNQLTTNKHDTSIISCGG